jgi:hypothetical protein
MNDQMEGRTTVFPYKNYQPGTTAPGYYETEQKSMKS